MGIFLALVLSSLAQTPGGPTYVAVSGDNFALAGKTTVLSASVYNGTGGPYTYQWFFNGTPIAGAANTDYAISNFQFTSVGRYRARATNNLGTIDSAEKRVDLLYWKTSDFSSTNGSFGALDPSFGSNLKAPPATVDLLPDGRVLVSGNGIKSGDTTEPEIARLNADGALDATFSVGINGTVKTLQPDGKILVLDKSNQIKRLTFSGALDSGFTPSTTYPPTVALIDGRYLSITLLTSGTKIDRLLSDGAVDLSYAGIVGARAYGPVRRLETHLDALGRVWLIGWDLLSYSNLVRIRRLNADGTDDPSFTEFTLTAEEITTQGVGDKMLFSGWSSSLGQISNVFQRRFNGDGTEDPTYVSSPFHFPYLVRQGTVSILFSYTNDGSGYVSLPSPRTPTALLFPVISTLYRFRAEGGIDPSFALDGFDANGIKAQPDGKLLVYGSFTSFYGTGRSYLVRIDPHGAVDLGRIANLSLRALAGTGDQTLIAGFIAKGTDPLPILLRGIGPTLANYGVTGVLPDPKLYLFSNSDIIGVNDNWEESDKTRISLATAFVGTTPLPTGSRDSAYLTSLSPGAYTAQVTTSSVTGVALAELYNAGTDTSSSTASRLANISGRAFVGSGEKALIAGFIIGGTTAKRIVVRAIGPTLKLFGVNGVLADPMLMIYQGSTPIATNDNWGDIIGSTDSVASLIGAYPLPTDSKDAMVFLSVPPGAYTAIVSSADGGTGVALVEVYEAP